MTDYTEECENLKKLHKPLYTIEAPCDSDEMDYYTCFFRAPNRTELAMIKKLAMSSDAVKANEFFVRNMYVGGDDKEALIKNDYALRSLDNSIIEIVTTKESRLKKN